MVSKPTDARTIVQRVLGGMEREIWSGSYDRALPITWQGFDLGAVLPAVFYMFRYGHRRGHGKFLDVFAPNEGSDRERRRAATVDRVATQLANDRETCTGFNGETEQAILGDLLLAFCLENVGRNLGRDRQIQRVAPAHYFASHLDLPKSVANLRLVPEMLVALIADQKTGQYVERTSDGKRTRFPMAARFEENPLLRAFGSGVQWSHVKGNRAGDRFNEHEDAVGVDQLLMIRLAQSVGEAPARLRRAGSGAISNQRPIAAKSAEEFSQDIRRFVREYSGSIPRQTFLELLETCMAVGLTTTLSSTLGVLFAWSEQGVVPPKSDQRPDGLFVDASSGVHRELRLLSERSLDDWMRRIEQLPALLMVLRLLDYSARNNRRIKTRKETPAKSPYATEWLDLLGDILHERHDDAKFVHQKMDDYAEELAEALEDDYQDVARIFRDGRSHSNGIQRLATGLTMLFGPDARRKDVVRMTDSLLYVGSPNGLARKRRVRASESGRQTRDARSLVLSDTALTYLAHLHLLPPGRGVGFRPLSLADFLRVLETRYGLHVDSPPPELPISTSLLRENREVLERRLRDLGLLTGVNDADAMKRLRPRFERARID